MRIVRDPINMGSCVLVLGMFDGVHRGHQALLMAGRDLADQYGMPLHVCTFEPHPLQVLRKEAAPPLLTTLTERAQLMASFGVDALCVHTFTRKVAAQEPEDFLRQLDEVYNPHAIVAMENIDAEIYLGGHNHKTLFITKIYRGLDYTPIRKSFCFTGSFLNYKGSYADNGRFDFQIPSFPVLTVDKDKNVNCKIYWGDEE